MIIKKRLIFYSKWNTVAIVESEMSLQAGQEKKILRGQIIIAKVTLERAHVLHCVNYNSFELVLS